MKRFIALLVVIITLVVLFGCSRITEGEVYQKEFKPAQTVLIFIPLVISNGQATTTILMPYWVYYPDRYVIAIKAFVNDEWKTATYYTNKETYESISVGYMFSYEEGRDLTEEPYIKTRAEEEACTQD